MHVEVTPVQQDHEALTHSYLLEVRNEQFKACQNRLGTYGHTDELKYQETRLTTDRAQTEGETPTSGLHKVEDTYRVMETVPLSHLTTQCVCVSGDPQADTSLWPLGL